MNRRNLVAILKRRVLHFLGFTLLEGGGALLLEDGSTKLDVWKRY